MGQGREEGAAARGRTLSARGRWALLVLVLATVGCDQATKRVAEEALAGEPRRSFLADTFRLEYAENAGAFLSLGADWPPAVRTAVLTIGSAAILLGAAWVAYRNRWSGRPLVAIALVFAGGISNLVDRASRGAVVDFLNVGVGSLRTGIFNVADLAITLGVVLLVWPARKQPQAGGASET